MKPFSGGQLLDAAKSPFHEALSHVQCIQYALDRPAVMTVLPGIRNEKDLDDVLAWLSASKEQKDYSALAAFDEISEPKTCVYCRHCMACPAGLDIALISKYYDLSRLGDILAADHYHHLEKKADDCISCGHCVMRCPFHVDQQNRMKEIAEWFSER